LLPFLSMPNFWVKKIRKKIKLYVKKIA